VHILDFGWTEVFGVNSDDSLAGLFVNSVFLLAASKPPDVV
jgi:hypothetical protein